MLDIRKVALSIPYRVICIADIHGNYMAFTRLLEKVNYNKNEDYLFILGDLLERGKDEEISTIDYLYELSKNDKVHIISGNNDRRMRYLQNEECVVNENEIVSVIDDSCEGYTHIRNSKGEIGWIPKGLVKYF